MFKPLLILFCCICICRLSAQDLLLRTAESLRDNVVRITVRLKNGSVQHGFGFITGEKNGVLYLATAAHVVHGTSFDKQPSQIQVWFYSDLLAHIAAEVTFFEAYDLAILQLTKPSALEYHRENWADFSPQNNQTVRYIGRDQEWLIPAQGEIYKFDNERIKAYMPTVRSGTSGAPLISEKGIVGLIIEDDNSEITAINLKKIREMFTQGERFPYFNAVTSDIANPRVRPIQYESDLNAYQMVKIEGGVFEMGCKPKRDGICVSEDVHQVNIRGFYLSKFEVTYQQFKVFVEATNYVTDAEKKGHSYTWTGAAWEKKAGLNWRCDVTGQIRKPEEYQHPVIYVSQNDAQAYCKWLSEQTGKAYRLPSIEEWEFAARGGSLSKEYRYAGSDNIKEVAWYGENAEMRTQSVGKLKANELGLFDLSGNVWEWCDDWLGNEYCKHSQGADYEYLVPGRGGSWLNFESDCRLAGIYCHSAKSSGNDFGFRLARKL